MRIAFNVSPLQSGHKVRGIGSYTRNLLGNLKQIPELIIQEFTDVSKVKDVDIIHYPFLDLFSFTLPLFKKFPTIVTIHDVTPLVFPKEYPIGILGKMNNFLQKISLKNVSAVITDSENSKEDICKLLDVEGKKVFPIYLSASGEFKVIEDKDVLDQVKLRYNLPDKFALYSGNINWNKNLINLAEACRKAQIDLVMVGSGFDTPDLNHPELRSFKVFLERFGEDDHIKILGFVGTQELVALINLATLTLLPSLYEGFGLPILESQACSTPVITSNISSMPEVAGEGAILVDPQNIEEIAKAIRSIREDLKLRNELISKGLENIKRFSWEKAAKETLEVYKMVANK